MQQASDCPRGHGRTRHCATFGLAALLGAGRLHAQTLPLPVIPQAPGGAVPAAPAGPEQYWDYDLELGAGYDSNADFVPEGAGAVLVRPRGEVARVFRGPRGRFRLGAGSRASVYASEDYENRVDANVFLGGSRELSPNVTLALDAAGELGYTDGNRLLGDQGVLLPLARTRTLVGQASVDWRAGARNSLRVEGRAHHVAFDDPVFVDSSSQRGALTLGRRVNDRASVSVQYSIEREWSGSSFLTHFGSLQWDQLMSMRSGLLLEGGASYTDQAATSGLASTWNFYGGASFSREVGRSRIVLFARREVTPVFGIGGLRLSDRFGLRADVPLGRAWQLGMAGSHIIHSAPESDGSERTSSDEATATLERRLGRQFFLGLAAQYRRRGPVGSTPETDGFQGG